MEELTDQLSDMDLSINVPALVIGCLFGFVGLWFFRRGRKELNNIHVVIGILLMIYPYFISGTLMTFLVGAGLCGAGYYFRDHRPNLL